MSNNQGIIIYDDNDLDSKMAAFLFYYYGTDITKSDLKHTIQNNIYNEVFGVVSDISAQPSLPYRLLPISLISNIDDYVKVRGRLWGKDFVNSLKRNDVFELIFLGAQNTIDYFSIINYKPSNRKEKVKIYVHSEEELYPLYLQFAKEYIEKDTFKFRSIKYKSLSLHETMSKNSSKLPEEFLVEEMKSNTNKRDSVIKTLGYDIKIYVSKSIYARRFTQIKITDIEPLHNTYLHQFSISPADNSSFGFYRYLKNINNDFFKTLTLLQTNEDFMTAYQINKFLIAQSIGE